MRGVVSRKATPPLGRHCQSLIYFTTEPFLDHGDFRDYVLPTDLYSLAFCVRSDKFVNILIPRPF